MTTFDVKFIASQNSDTFIDPKTKEKASKVLRSSYDVENASSRPPILGNESVESTIPLTPTQRDLYLASAVNTSARDNCIGYGFKLNTDFDTGLWRFVLECVQAEQPMLRAVLRKLDEALMPVLSVQCHASVDFQYFDVRDAHWDEAQLQAAADEFMYRSFGLFAGPLIRHAVWRLADQQYFCLTSSHHIILDGIGVVAHLRRALALYNQNKGFEHHDDIQIENNFHEYAEQAAGGFDTPVIEDFWSQELADIEPLGLGSSLSSPRENGSQGASLIDARLIEEREALSPELTHAIQSYCDQRKMSVPFFLRNLFALLLSRYSRAQKPFYMQSMHNGRPVDHINTLGTYVNSSLFVFDPDWFTQDMDHLSKKANEFRKKAKGLENISTGLRRRLIGDDSLEFIFNYIHFVPMVNTHGQSERVHQFINFMPGQVQMIPRLVDGLLSLNLYYFDGEFESFNAMARIKGMLEQLLAAEEKNLAQLDLIFESEKNQLQQWNQTRYDYDLSQGVHTLIRQQAEKTPEAIALSFTDSSLTGSKGMITVDYQSLEARSNQLAHYLIEQGVTADTLIGICMERSIEMVIAILGILKAGGAYVPVDPYYPESRVRYMLSDSSVPCVLTQSHIQQSYFADTKAVLMDSMEFQERLSTYPTSEPQIAFDPSQLAYVIYTSGSTGEPKGVMNEHRGLMNRLHWMQREYQLDGSDAVLQKTPFSFDVSVWEFLWPLMVGARLVIAKPEGHKDARYLVDLIQAEQITTLHFVPSMLRVMLFEESERWSQCTSLKRVICSGEALPAELVEQFDDSSNGAGLFNLYGPTEAAIDVTHYPCAELEEGAGSVPIGRAIDNLQIHILDEQGQVMPIGIAGELHIGGVGVARGYLNKAELSAERFIVDPFIALLSEAPLSELDRDASIPSRMYKTGDLARYREDGVIEYLGRMDHQVKLRGLRIELGEIESGLRADERVQDAVVVVSDDRLAAYVVLETGAYHDEDGLSASLSRVLKHQLPEFMVPQDYVYLDTFPLSPNGKLDRKALPSVDRDHQQADVIAPETPTEIELSHIWAELLKIDLEQRLIGVDEAFLQLGGYSILATRAIAKIRHRFSVEISFKDFLEQSTIRNIAILIDDLRDQKGLLSDSLDSDRIESESAVFQSIKKYDYGNDRVPLSFAQERIWLVNHLDPNNLAYHMGAVLSLNELMDLNRLQSAIDVVVQRHSILRSVFLEESGEAYQCAMDWSPVIEFQEMTVRDANELQASVNDQAALVLNTPFDIKNTPGFRVYLHRYQCLDQPEQSKDILMLVMHHVILDGWSMPVLLSEISDCYRSGDSKPGSDLSANEPTLQYADFVHWQREWLRDERLQAQIDYWVHQLKDAPRQLALPTDYPRPDSADGKAHYEGRSIPIAFDASIVGAAKAFCQQHQVTLFTLLLSAYHITLARYCHQDDLCIGVPVAGRNHPDLDRLLGYFVNSVVVRTRSEFNPSVRELIDEVHATLLEAYQNQDAPVDMALGHISEQFGQHDFNVQVGFSLQDDALSNTLSGFLGSGAEAVNVAHQSSKLDMSLLLLEKDNGLDGALEYSTLLFEEATVEAFFSHYKHVVSQIIDNSDARVNDISVIGDDALTHLIAENALMVRDNIERVLPLTPSQEAIYLDALVYSSSKKNNLGEKISVDHPVDVNVLKRAIEQVQHDQPLLRSRIVSGPKHYTDIAYQVVLNQDPISVHVETVSSEQIADAQYIEARCEQHFLDHYDIHAELHRWLLITDGQRSVIALGAHHILVDGVGGVMYWSSVLDAYQALYTGKPLEKKEWPYLDFLDNVRQQSDRPESLDFWQQQCKGIMPLIMPLESKERGSSHQEDEFIQQSLCLPNDHWQAIKHYCRSHRVTPTLYFQALYALLIRHYCRADSDFYMLDYRNNRTQAHQRVAGCYYQQVPFVAHAELFVESDTFSQLLAGFRKTIKAIKPHQNISIRKQAHLLPAEGLRFIYNFYHFLLDYDFLGESQLIGGITPRIENAIQFLPKVITSPEADVDTVLELNLAYQDRRFEHLHFLDRLEYISEQILTGVSGLNDIMYVLPDEKTQLQQWNQTHYDYDLSQGVHTLIRQQAEKTPEAVALSFTDSTGITTVDYQSLEARSNQLAHYLIEQGVSADTLIGICMERSIEMVVAILGILKAGGAYVPVDPYYPESRVRYMLSDSDVPCVLTQSHIQQSYFAGTQAVLMDSIEFQERLSSYPTSEPQIAFDASQLAYVIYTSGSTGEPKGVMNEHRGLMNRLHWMQREYQLDGSDAVLQKTPFSFDVSVWEFLWPLMAGARLVIAKPEGHKDARYLVDLIQAEQITTLHFVPSMLRVMLFEESERWSQCTALKRVICSGEALPAELVDQFNDCANGSGLFNLYGPTEAAIDVTHYPCAELEEGAGSVPIGRAIDNLQIHILDEQGQVMPIGIAGELHIGGVGVARGYLNKAELSAERFIIDPFIDLFSGRDGDATIALSRLYKTGDLARYREDGVIEYLGRMDHQVKLRGLRIELGEIESGLRADERVQDAVVVVMDERLVAYLILEASASEQDDSELTAKLSTVLRGLIPEFMVPQDYVILDEFPLSPNGKLDRKALPKPQRGETAFIAPATDTEKGLEALWSEVLKKDSISATANFFDLGGHSLSATRLLARVRKVFGVDLPLKLLFETPTLRFMAESIDSLMDSSKSDQVVEASAGEHVSKDSTSWPIPAYYEKPYLAPLSLNQERLWLVHQLEPNSSVYHLHVDIKISGEIDEVAFAAALNSVIARHDSLRTFFVDTTEGPRQKVLDEEQGEHIPTLDLRDLRDDKQSEIGSEIGDIQHSLVHTPFDLAASVPARFCLLRTRDDEHRLMVVLHHIISDGVSIKLMIGEWMSKYASTLRLENQDSASLPIIEDESRAPLQYADFARWETLQQDNGAFEADADFWYQQLNDAPESLSLPTDFPRGSTQSFAGKSLNVSLPKQLSERLEAFCEEHNATPFMVLLMAYQLLLGRYSHQKDICVAVPSAGRTTEQQETALGFYVNTLVLRAQFPDNPSIAQLLDDVRETTLGAFQHQSVPVSVILDRIQLKRDMRQTPGAQVAFALQNVAEDGYELTVGDVHLALQAQAHETAKCDLTLMFWPVDGRYDGMIEYASSLYEESTVQRFYQHYLYLLSQLLDDAEQSVESLALCNWQQAGQAVMTANAIDASTVERVLPLSKTQAAIYLDSLLNTHSRQNRLGVSAILESAVDPQYFRETLSLTLNAHPLLRTRIVQSQTPYLDLAYQVVFRELEEDPVFIDLTDKDKPVFDLDLPGHQAHLDQLVNDFLLAPYSVTDINAPLSRVMVVRLAPARHVLAVAAHHAIMDGACLVKYVMDLGQYYELVSTQLIDDRSQHGSSQDEASAIDTPTWQFPDFIEQQAKSVDKRETIQFWRDAFTHVEPLNTCFSVMPFTASEDDKAIDPKCHQSLMLDDEHWADIKAYCRQKRTFPPLYFKMLFGLMMQRYCQPASDFYLLDYLLGRTKDNAYDMGCYYQQQPFVFKKDWFGKDATFSDLLKSSRNAHRDIKKHRDLSIARQVDICPAGGLRFMFNYQGFIPVVEFGGREYCAAGLLPDVADAVQLMPKVLGDSIELNLQYHLDQFNDHGFLERLLNISKQIVSGADRLADLSLWLNDERKTIESTLMGDAVEYPKAARIESLIASASQEHKTRLAVKARDAEYTYKALDAYANQWARRLQAQGVQPGDTVGVCLGRSADVVVAILSVLKSGATYLPIDSSYPSARIELMLKDAQVEVVLTHNDTWSAIDCAYEGVCLAMDDHDTQQSVKSLASDRLILPESSRANVDDSWVYAVFTSGSTGVPKRTGATHQSVSNLLSWYTRTLAMTPKDKVLVISALGFDLTQKNLLAPLMMGACIVLPEDDYFDASRVAQQIQDDGISMINGAPSMLYGLLESGCLSSRDLSFSCLSRVVLGGEAIQLDRLQPWLEENPSIRLINSYGPSECTDVVAFAEYNSQRDIESIPLGGPIDNTRLYLMDEHGVEVPAECLGELCIAGVPVGPGYPGDVDKTSAKFISHPMTGERLYRTGDLCRLGIDGQIQFVGRVDHQVKLRGLRIELGEIEACLDQHPSITQSVVDVRNDTLIAYCVLDSKTPSNDAVIEALRDRVSGRLPQYMMPQRFVFLDTFPLTANGKIDRKALPDAESECVQVVEASTDTEHALQRLWTEILGRPAASVTQTFFEAGGHSLMATRLVAKMKAHFQMEFPLAVLFEHQTIRSMASYIDRIVGQGGESGQALEVIPKVSRDGLLPLSFNQERVWLVSQIAGSSAAYNMPMALRIKGALDASVLERALQTVVMRHESLRSTVVVEQGTDDQTHRPLQKIHQDVDIQLHTVEVSADHAEAEAIILKAIKKEASKPFDLTKDLLLRASLYSVCTSGVVESQKAQSQDHVLLTTLHHMAADGWSIEILIREWLLCYEAYRHQRSPLLEPLDLQYVDYATWQREYMGSDHAQGDLNYWREQLSGIPTMHSLPTDFPRPVRQSFNGRVYTQHISSEALVGIQDAVSQKNTTLFIYLQTVFAALLSRYSLSDDIVLGSPIANRERLEFASVMGFFANTIVLRNDFSQDPSFDQALTAAHTMATEAYAHQSLPFEYLVDALNPERSLSHTPVFQIMFSLQRVDGGSRRSMGEFELELLESEERVAKFDLNVAASETPDGLRIDWEYNTSLWTEAFIEDMTVAYQRLLNAVTQDASCRLSRIGLRDVVLRDVVSREAALQTESPHADQRALPNTKASRTIYDLFVEQVQRTPHAVAIVQAGVEDTRLTYEELSTMVHQRANALSSDRGGVDIGDRVALCFSPGIEWLAHALAVLKLGASYMPLDPSYPRQRLRYIIEDAAPKVLLMDGETVGQVFDDSEQTAQRVFCIDDGEYQRFIESQPLTSLDVEFDPSKTLTYVIYTSGSTGTPKCTGAYQNAVVNLLQWYQRTGDMTADDRVLLLSAIGFDLTQKNLFAPLISGARIVIPDMPRFDVDYALSTIDSEAITWLNVAPSVFYTLIDQITQDETRQLSSLKSVFLGGEALHEQRLANWLATNDCQVVNSYGPTECTDVVCAHVIDPHGADRDTQNIPIGTAIEGVELFVLDAGLNPVPPGVVGELYIGGIAVGPGYLNDPTLTADKFIDTQAYGLSFSASERLYKTGDWARLRRDGLIEFVGRIDHQVKVRGLRIELGEISHQLRQHEAVKEAVVIVKDDQLHAYLELLGDRVLLGEKQGELVETVQQNLSQTLPEYLLPHTYTVVDAMPLSVNGKIDIKQLPDPVMVEAHYEAPANEVEERLQAIWQSLLGNDRISVSASFFKLGGHSLLATQMVSKVRDALQLELPMHAVFQHQTIRTLAQYLATQKRLQGEGDRSFALPAIRKADDSTGLIPASYAQSRMWMLDQIETSKAAYTIPLVFYVDGELDVDAFNEAVSTIVDRHEVLRSVIRHIDGEVVQQTLTIEDVRSSFMPLFPSSSLIGLEEQQKTEAIRNALMNTLLRPFDLETDIMLRGQLMRLDDHTTLVIAAMHHIASDGRSTQVFLKELATLYYAYANGLSNPMLAPSYQYSDYSAWQREWLHPGSAVYESELSYWKQQLTDLPTVHSLPLDRARNVAARRTGAYVRQTIPSELMPALRAMCEREGVTPFMVMYTAFAMLVSRFSGEEDIAMGTPIAGRTQSELEDMMGLFVNTLVLRLNVDPELSFDALLQNAKAMTLDAYAHQHLPFEMLVDEINPERSIHFTPLFQILFSLQEGPVSQTMEQGGLNIRTFDPSDWANANSAEEPDASMALPAKFDLQVTVHHDDNDCSVDWFYNAALFDQAKIQTMADAFGVLMEVLLSPQQATHQQSSHEEPIGSVPLLSHERYLNALDAASGPKVEFDSQWIHRQFERRVDQQPTTVALRFEGQTLSYDQLNIKANQLAHYLVRQGLQPQQWVGICLNRSFDMVISILAVLKVGAVYVPIDPNYPSSRIEYMLEDSEAPMLLGELQSLETLELASYSGQQITLDDDGLQRVLETHPCTNLSVVDGDPGEACLYAVYTSGTTGKPKRTAAYQRSVCSLLQWYATTLDMAQDDRVMLVSAFGFDLTQKNIFAPLLSGASLVLPSCELYDSPMLLDLIEQEQVTWINPAPSTFYPLIESTERWDQFSSVRRVVLGGEPLSYQRIREWLRQSTCEVINTYGPSEATDISCYHRVDARVDYGDVIPLGKAIDNVHCYVMDAHRQLVPAGVVGELYVGGVSVGPGYGNDEALTQEKFVANPFAEGRLYQTGDLVRYLENGDLEFVGRVDHQVKIRGMRVELGEIESRIRHLDDVIDVTVVAVDEVLAAYVLSDGISGQDEAQFIQSLRTQLMSELPHHMVPSAFVLLDAFPLTPNGKINRSALPKPVLTSRETVAPRNEREATFCHIWRDVLGVDVLGVQDDFFEIGGHSLLAVALVSRINKAFDTDFVLSDLFSAPTIEGFANLIESKQNQSEASEKESLLIRLNADRDVESALPVFCVHAIGGTVEAYRPLARSLDRPVYGIQARGLLPGQESLESITEMAKLYVSAIREVQASGPYELVGHSIGGLVALEMAKQLTLAGEAVSSVKMLDTFLLNRVYDDFNDSKDDIMRMLQEAGVPVEGFASQLSFDVERDAKLVEKALEFGLIPSREDADAYLRLYALHLAHFKMAIAYDVEPALSVVDAPVCLYRAKDNERDAVESWGELAERLLVTEVDGDHEGMLKAGKAGFGLYSELANTQVP